MRSGSRLKRTVKVFEPLGLIGTGTAERNRFKDERIKIEIEVSGLSACAL
jgi:hypothetical protein